MTAPSSLYTVLPAAGGAIVLPFTGGDPHWKKRTPPLAPLPRLPHTSAEWIDHELGSDGKLLRVSRSLPALSVTVSSLAGNVAETGDGTNERPFVNLNSVAERFGDCMIHAMRCAGTMLSVTVTGTVDYPVRLTGGSGGLPAGREDRDVVLYDFGGAVFTSAAAVERAGYGAIVIRDWSAPRAAIRRCEKMVFDRCSWGGLSAGVSAMRRATDCAFDECFCSAGSFFDSMVRCTVAGGRAVAAEVAAIRAAESCVFSGVSVGCSRMTPGGGAVTNCRASLFEECSASAEFELAGLLADNIFGAVYDCASCTFDRCAATVSTVGSPANSASCQQGCAFWNNSGSLFNECLGNSVCVGACGARCGDLRCDL